MLSWIETKDKKGLISNDSKNLSHEKIFQNLFKERLDEIIELTDETNFDRLIYYFKGDCSRKKFDSFKNEIKPFE